jgi:hypothetical protein
MRRPRSDSIRSLTSESSAQTQSLNIPTLEKKQKKYLEILVHNVSHTDLILGLSSDETWDESKFLSSLTTSVDAPPFVAEYEKTPRRTNHSLGRDHNKSNTGIKSKNDATTNEKHDEKYILFRPRFSAFDLFSKRVLREL